MCYNLNKRRQYLATYNRKIQRKVRKIIRAERKNKGVTQKQTEGTVYKAGAF